MDPINAQSNGAHIGKSVVIKGELSGSENLFVDGEVEGSIHLEGHTLTIGKNGRVRASVKAKDVMIHGRVDGNVQAGDHLELRASAVVMGDLLSKRIAVEDGALLQGKIETVRESSSQSKQPATSQTATGSSPLASAAVPAAESKA